MERGKVLLEFELLIEAEKALKLGSILVGGLLLRLEKWKPKTRCLLEGEKKSEAWVRVVGLLVSLWDRDILRRIGEECGGFLAVDSQMEKLEELQWARMLVKRNGEELPNVVEVWVEELCYSLTLWWEVRSVMKAATVGKSGKKVVIVGEVGGEAFACAGERVLEANDVTRLEALLLPADGTRGQSSGSGQSMDPVRSFDGEPVGPQGSGGPLLSSLAEVPWSSKASRSTGLAPLSDISFETGSSILGLSSRKTSGWAKTLESFVVPGLDS